VRALSRSQLLALRHTLPHHALAAGGAAVWPFTPLPGGSSFPPCPPLPLCTWEGEDHHLMSGTPSAPAPAFPCSGPTSAMLTPLLFIPAPARALPSLLFAFSYRSLHCLP